jgi:hypothetical protein
MKESLKDKSYRLTDNRSGSTLMLMVGRKGNLTIMDEKKKTRRAIRHCPNQTSIYRDEQDSFAVVSPIIFEGGYIKVKGDQPMTQKFLNEHPSNKANGGEWFELVDDEMEAKESIENEELKIDLKYLVRQKSKEKDGIHALKAEVSVILGSVDQAGSKGIEELKQSLYNEIESNPDYFTDESGNPTIFDNDEVLRKYIVLKSIKDGVIRKSPNNKSIVWAKTKAVIATAPVGVDLVDYFTSYLSTDDGILVLEEITRRS